MSDMIDMGSYVKFMGALAFVLGLILLLTWAVKRFGIVQGVPQRRARGDRRIQIVETQALDTRRRVVLLRHDGTEHLVLLGPNNDVVLGAPRAATTFTDILDDAEPARDDNPAETGGRETKA